MKKAQSYAAILAACVWSCAYASPVPENESNGFAANNSLIAAQVISGSAFSPNADPNVFGTLMTASVLGRGGGNDIDVYSFTTPGGNAYFDIDGGASGYDSYLALFSSSGTLIADNDDSFPADAGSASDFDAFLGTVFLANPGTYFVVVATSGNAALATFTGSLFTELSRPDGEYGGFAFGDATPGDSSFAFNDVQVGDAYTLHISVPAPGFGVIALGGFAFMSRRRRAR